MAKCFFRAEIPALKNIDGTLEYFSTPKHPEKVQDIDEIHVARTAGDGVERNENQTAVGMLLPEGFEAFAVLGLHMLGRLNLDGHFGVTDYDIDLLVVVGVPIGYDVALVVVATIGDDFLHHQVFEGMAVVVGTTFQGVSPHQVVGQPDIEIVESRRLDHLALDFLAESRNLISNKRVIEYLEIRLDRFG